MYFLLVEVAIKFSVVECYVIGIFLLFLIVCVCLYAGEVCQGVFERNYFNIPLSHFAVWWGYRSPASRASPDS